MALLSRNVCPVAAAAAVAVVAVVVMQWRNDLREGKGTAVFDGGRSRYEGDWRRDLRHGRGLEALRDGSRYAGSYLCGIRQGEYVC